MSNAVVDSEPIFVDVYVPNLIMSSTPHIVCIAHSDFPPIS